ncbi:MAG: hypothetical protein IKE95_07500 [Methanobrevibacter sp.]|nr:hypothetical protein [Methanobrevibacter sp.]
MEFISNNRKYAIINHELYIDYLIVDSYFRQGHSKYDYDITFDFIDPILLKDKVEFADILEGTKLLEELIEKQEVNFIKPDFVISQKSNGDFVIYYQDLVFENLKVGEAIPVLICLYTLLDYKPVISLTQINEELENFIECFRKY